MKLRLFILAAAVSVLPLAVSPSAVGARAALSLNPAVGPPTTITKVKGSGYAAREVVALFFDGGRVGSTLSGPTGKFNSSLVMPAAARPGEHAVEAVGVSSGVESRARFLVRTDWLQGCFEAGRSCFNPYENVIGPGNAGALALAWRAHPTADGTSSPVYANGRLFVGTAHGLAVLDPATGAIIINFRTGPVSTTPAVIRGFDPQPDPPGKVIFGSTDGMLQAVSTDGTPLWQVGLGHAPASPLVIQGAEDPVGQVVVGAGNVLYAFDGNGNRQWATVLEGGDISKAAALLVEPDTKMVTAAAGNTLYALDAANGQIIWANTPSVRRLGAPAIGDPNQVPNPNVLVGDQGGNLYSLDPRTGQVKASFTGQGPITGSPAIGDPTLSDPWVMFGDGGGNIYAADQTDDFPPPIWQAALGGPVDGPPVLANGVVYVATDPEDGTDPHLFALDQASGRVLFDSVLPGGVAGGPIVADGKVIVATRSSDVVGYETPDT